MKRIAVYSVSVLALMLTGCFDDKYDLSDIDKKIRVQVNDLVVPINISPITLDYALNLDEDPNGIIRKYQDMYAVVVDGYFTSDDININNITMTTAQVPSVSAMMSKTTGSSDELCYKLVTPIVSDFSYNANSLDPSIAGIDNIGVEWSLGIKIKIQVTPNEIESMRIENFDLKIPAGLVGTPNYGTYNSAEGNVHINEANLINGTLQFEMPITELDVIKLSEEGKFAFDKKSHTISFNDGIGAVSGDVIIEKKPGSSYQPSGIVITTTPVLSQMYINSFTGIIAHEIEGFDIEALNLTDLPEILTQEGTNITLANPQMFLSVYNPFSKYDLDITSGISLTPFRHDVQYTSLQPDRGNFEIGANGSGDNYCLVFAPDPTEAIENPAEGFNDIHPVLFTALRDLLAGDGMPTTVEIKMLNPQVPPTRVENFELGNLGKVNGKYAFVAPLQFMEGTQIIYNKTFDDWDSEDLENLTITTLKVNLNITNDFPIGLHFEAYPLDSDGNRLDARIKGVEVPANCTNQPIEIALEGTVNGVAGIELEARAMANTNARPLSPSLNITVKDVRATVGGYYDKDLDD